MIRLGDLLTIPDLQLEIRVYAPGRDPSLRWPRMLTSFDDVGQLHGGELILIDHDLPQAPSAERHLVSALAHQDAAALAVPPGSEGTVARDLVTACEEQHLPLVEIPAPTTCGEVAEAVISRAHDGPSPYGPAEWTPCEARFLSRFLSSRDGISAILDFCYSEYGVRMWVVSHGAAFVAPGLPPPSEDDVQSVFETASALESGYLRLTLGDRTEACVFRVEGPDACGRLPSYLVTELPDGGFSSEVCRAVGCAIPSVQAGLNIVHTLRCTRTSLEEDFMRRVEAGHVSSGELTVWAQALEFPLQSRLYCVLVRAPELSESDATLVANGLRNMADSLKTAHTVITCATEVRAFLFSEYSDSSVIEDALKRAEALLHTPLSQLGATIGTSSVMATSISDFNRVLLDTRQVCDFNAVRQLGCDQPDSSLGASLLAHDRNSQSVLYETILAPLQSYDRGHQSDLVHTLDVFLSTCGQWNSSANQLGVHVNTVRYRMARIEEITGRKISSMSELVDLYLALHTSRIISSGS